MSKNNLNDHVTQNLKQSIYKVLEEGPTSERNLSQFRERMASEKAERVARANELRQKNAAQEAARNTPEAIAKREEARAAAHAHNVHYDATHTSPTRIKYNPNSKASINPDGSFNISPQAQAQAQTNRDAIAAGREQDRERTARLGVPAQQGVQGFDASGRTIKPNPNFRYVNPNTTPKIEEPLQNTSTPDASTALAAARANTQRQLNTMRTIDRISPRAFDALYPPNSPIANVDSPVY